MFRLFEKVQSAHGAKVVALLAADLDVSVTIILLQTFSELQYSISVRLSENRSQQVESTEVDGN